MCLQALWGLDKHTHDETAHMDFGKAAHKEKKNKRCKVVFNEYLFWSGDFQNER